NATVSAANPHGKPIPHGDEAEDGAVRFRAGCVALLWGLPIRVRAGQRDKETDEKRIRLAPCFLENLPLPGGRCAPTSPYFLEGIWRSDKPNVYLNLKTLLQREPEAINSGKRVYRVCYGADSGYVLTNSPGNAALAVCDVEG